MLCNKEPEDLVRLSLLSGDKRAPCIDHVYGSVDDWFSWQQGRGGIRFHFLSCGFSRSQMYSGWSLVLFGLVTTFNKEDLDLV